MDTVYLTVTVTDISSVNDIHLFMYILTTQLVLTNWNIIVCFTCSMVTVCLRIWKWKFEDEHILYTVSLTGVHTIIMTYCTLQIWKIVCQWNNIVYFFANGKRNKLYMYMYMFNVKKYIFKDCTVHHVWCTDVHVCRNCSVQYSCKLYMFSMHCIYILDMFNFITLIFVMHVHLHVQIQCMHTWTMYIYIQYTIWIESVLFMFFFLLIRLNSSDYVQFLYWLVYILGNHCVSRNRSIYLKNWQTAMYLPETWLVFYTCTIYSGFVFDLLFYSCLDKINMRQKLIKLKSPCFLLFIVVW